MSEIMRPMGAKDFCPAPDCDQPVAQFFSRAYLFGARVEDSENVGAERTDGTAGINIGLPGENVSLGKDSSGKEHFEYRPRRSSELSNAQTREIAKANNLTPLERGRYRTVGQGQR